MTWEQRLPPLELFSNEHDCFRTQKYQIKLDSLFRESKTRYIKHMGVLPRHGAIRPFCNGSGNQTTLKNFRHHGAVLALKWKLEALATHLWLYMHWFWHIFTSLGDAALKGDVFALFPLLNQDCATTRHFYELNGQHAGESLMLIHTTVLQDTCLQIWKSADIAIRWVLSCHNSVNYLPKVKNYTNNNTHFHSPLQLHFWPKWASAKCFSLTSVTDRGITKLPNRWVIWVAFIFPPKIRQSLSPRSSFHVPIVWHIKHL